MFRTVRLSIVSSLFTVHSAMVYVIKVCRQLSSRSICSCSKAVYKPVWHIPLSWNVFYVHVTVHHKKFLCKKPTRCTNFTNLFCHETTCFGQFVCPSSGVYSLYTQQMYMSYRFVGRCRAGAHTHIYIYIRVYINIIVRKYKTINIKQYEQISEPALLP